MHSGLPRAKSQRRTTSPNLAKPLRPLATSQPSTQPAVVVITISWSKYPEAAQHILDAQAAGKPSILTIDGLGADARRGASLAGIDKVPGQQLDEYPLAMFKEGGA